MPPLSTLFLTPVAYLLLGRFATPHVEDEARLKRELDHAAGPGEMKPGRIGAGRSGRQGLMKTLPLGFASSSGTRAMASASGTMAVTSVFQRPSAKRFCASMTAFLAPLAGLTHPFGQPEALDVLVLKISWPGSRIRVSPRSMRP